MPFVSSLLMTGRVLTFRAGAALGQIDRRHLGFGLFITWLVGVGRYWDAPNTSLAQHLGIGSVLYVFVLALLLWAVPRPLVDAERWSYERVLTFITLTALPALLYAIPVERFFSFGVARTINAWFLAVVAAWRVALFFYYVIGYARLSWFRAVVVALLPLTVIVTGLTMLNLERAVFNLMAGLGAQPGTSNDQAYQILVMLTVLSMCALPVLLISYLVMVLQELRVRRAKAE